MRGLGRLVQLPAQVRAWIGARQMSWIEEQRLVGCAYPRSEGEVAALRRVGITTIVNLHERGHAAERLARHGIGEVHMPVRDFTAPTQEQLEQGVSAIKEALAGGGRVAVHCGAGLGRTGTLLACYLVSTGLEPEAAIARVRAVRPGSVETREQEAAVRAFAARLST